jgi:hypothetical protein
VAEPAQTRFVARQQLVALFKAQLDLLRRADPQGIGRHLDAVRLSRYDELLAQGPAGRWPAGWLSGLKQGIRDQQFMLDMAYPAAQQEGVRLELRAAAGAAVDLLEARDAKRLEGILKRKRIRTEDEYHLVRAAIDRLEADTTPDVKGLRELYAIADAASAGGAA